MTVIMVMVWVMLPPAAGGAVLPVKGRVIAGLRRVGDVRSSGPVTPGMAGAPALAAPVPRTVFSAVSKSAALLLPLPEVVLLLAILA